MEQKGSGGMHKGQRNPFNPGKKKEGDRKKAVTERQRELEGGNPRPCHTLRC